jgi:hypothetical protein
MEPEGEVSGPTPSVEVAAPSPHEECGWEEGNHAMLISIETFDPKKAEAVSACMRWQVLLRPRVIDQAHQHRHETTYIVMRQPYITSPRSLEACKVVGVQPEELLELPFEYILGRASKKEDAQVTKLRYDRFEVIRYEISCPVYLYRRGSRHHKVIRRDADRCLPGTWMSNACLDAPCRRRYIQKVKEERHLIVQREHKQQEESAAPQRTIEEIR